jgi:hypothetical protein
MMRRVIFLSAAIVAAVVLLAGAGLAESRPGGQQQTSYTGKDQTFTVMTQNVYHGVDAELNRSASARTFNEFFAATSATFNGYHERKFPERADRIAA